MEWTHETQVRCSQASLIEEFRISKSNSPGNRWLLIARSTGVSFASSNPGHPAVERPYPMTVRDDAQRQSELGNARHALAHSLQGVPSERPSHLAWQGKCLTGT